MLARVEGRLGRITLNRPKALNALTHAMVGAVDAALTRFAADETVAAVLLDGAGERGLCAGGDIRAIHRACVAGDRAPIRFWQDEYRLNARIAAYPKPLVALMDGIVMGGGIGVSAHAAHRVVTERTVIAMPEVSIGFIPDVGGTFLLSRAPGELGTHVALTAARLGAADAVALDLADHHVDRSALPGLVEALRACAGTEDVDGALRASASDAGTSPLAGQRGWIDAAYAADDVEAIMARLAETPGDGARAAREAIGRMSPSALKLTLRALRDGRRLGELRACLAMELRIGAASLARPDLPEGIRAAIIDKDASPRWTPATLEEVTPEMVEACFRPIGDDELTFEPARDAA